MPSEEPTLQERQRLAFRFLKQEALEAHSEGDGLRINLLCRTAFDGIKHLITEGNFLLPLREVHWAFIFQFYWLLDHYVGHLTVEMLKKIPRVDKQDELIGSFLECHQYMIQEPLSGLHPAFDKLRGLSLEALAPEPALEEAELLTHLAELAWFRSAGTGEWRDLLASWQQHKTPWIAELSSVLRRRLEWQTRMVVPSGKYPIVPEESISEVRGQFELAELWLLHLHGRGSAVVDRVCQLSSSTTPDSYRWRIVLDFWHVHRPFGPSDTDEEQARWLARRRSLTADSPLLQFHDRREFRIVEKLGDLFRERVASNASTRRDVMQLAMLHEITAMRLWDYGMWREATKAQSEIWLESSLWMSDQPQIVAHGLVLGARTLSLKSSSKASLTRSGVERLEFAPVGVLGAMADQLFAAYPIQKYCISELIDEIADLFPSDTWQRLAEWTAIAVREMNEKRSTGEKTGPGAFWWKILPSVEKNSPIWNILLAEALEMAANKLCWHDEGGAFLRLWIEHAPLDLARQIAEAILRATPPENFFSLDRAQLFADVENDRPELLHEFTSRLPQPGPSREERMLIAEHLNIDPDDSEAIGGRDVFAGKLAERLLLMVLPEGETKSNVPFERLGLARVKRWEIKHRPLFESLLATLHHPRVIVVHIPELLNSLQLMIADGPSEFALIARASIESWILEPPGAGATPDNQQNPFSIFHSSGAGAGAVQEQLGWIVFQYLTREGAAAADLVDAMTAMAIRHHWQQSTGILCRCLIVLASKMPIAAVPERMLQMSRLLEVLRAQLKWDHSAASHLAEALNFVAGLVGPLRDKWIDWDSEQGKKLIFELVQILGTILPTAASSPSASLRIMAARTLAFLHAWQKVPDEMMTILHRLTKDNRARVRLAAKLTPKLSNEVPALSGSPSAPRT